jgi:cysteinyl-tRNA synthetase
LAFDVVRRVLEDYFGYSILYVMNITDVEDKIILRARRNYLLKGYLEQNSKDTARVLGDARTALATAEAKQLEKCTVADADLAQAEVDVAAGGPTASEAAKRREGLADAAASEQLLLSKATAAVKELEALGSNPSITTDAILALAGDALAIQLDTELKHTVADPSIFRGHAAHFEKAFLEDMATLGVRPPTVLTRVTEYIPEIVSYVEKIVANGMAYVSPEGSVYFDTQSFRSQGHTYGKLNPWAVGSALAAEGEPGGDKRHPSDFALWKAAKPGEPTWDSPWGAGRPGWHIECSAMASAVIGQQVDIHTGGEDLRFPHHDNELAQAEAHYHCEGCQQWVNYFLHSGHLGIEGLKMSKSLKNFVTIRLVYYSIILVLLKF